MNPDLKKELEARIATRHSWLKKAMELIKNNDPQYEFFSDLAEREQHGIEKLQNWYPLSQV